MIRTKSDFAIKKISELRNGQEMTATIKRISLPVLLALLLSGCATTSAIRPQNNAQNSQTFYSPIRLFDANEHIAIANNFCKDKNKAEIAKINTHRDTNRHGDIMRTTFFCGTPEKIQQIEEQQAKEKERLQKIAEEQKQAEIKKRAEDAENAAKAKAKEANRKNESKTGRQLEIKQISSLAILTCVSAEMTWARYSNENPKFYIQLADGWYSVLEEKMGKPEAESYSMKNLRRVTGAQLEDAKLLLKQHLDCFKLYTELPQHAMQKHFNFESNK